MSRILAITGATGRKSGGVFSDVISKNIAEVKKYFPDGIKALVRVQSNTSILEKKIPGLKIERGDFEDIEFLENALIEVDTLVHIAGIHTSKKIVTAASKAKVRRLILVHTTGIYSKYKAAGEEYRKIDESIYKICKRQNIGLTILRPTMIYGNLTDDNICVFIKMVDKLPIMPVVNGARYALQPVHYEDLGKAYYDVMIHEKETWNHDYILSGGAPIELRDIFLSIGEKLEKNVKFFSVPFLIAYTGSIILYWLSGRKLDYREQVQRLCEPRVFSYSEAETDFGYKPRDFYTGIIDEIKEYQSAKIIAR